MIEINLLPTELRKKKKAFKMPQINLGSVPVIISIAAVFLLIHLVLLLVININKRAFEKMSVEWKEARPQKEAIELIRRENIKTTKNVEAIEKLMDKKIMWSKKLNQLSDLLIPGVWYTRIMIDKKTLVLEGKEAGKKKIGAAAFKKTDQKKIEIAYLIIEGEVSAIYGEELAIIGKFIDGLKNDPEFFKDFTNIELDSTGLHSITDTEVMKFSINCYFEKEIKEDESG